MKRTVFVGGLAVLGVATLAVAQMLPPGGGRSQDAAEFAFVTPPPPGDSAVLRDQDEEVLAEVDAAISEARQRGDEQDLDDLQELKDLLEQQAHLTEAERKAEDDYLSLKLGPDVNVSGVERVPSADENQPYRTCEKTPEMKANLNRHGDEGDRAYRDIAGYLSVTNVIATKDCTCTGKVIPHEAVAMFEDKLRDQLGVNILEPNHTRNLYKEYDRQLKVIAVMCGEY